MGQARPLKQRGEKVDGGLALEGFAFLFGVFLFFEG